MSTLYFLIDLLTVLALLFLMALALLGGGYKNKLNRLYALFAVMLAVWLPANHLGGSLYVSEEAAIIFNYLVFGCSFAATLLLAKMISVMSQLKLENAIFSIGEKFLWPFVLLSMTPLVGKDVYEQNGMYGVVFGPLGWLYGLLLFVVILFMMFNVVRGIRVQSGVIKERLSSVGLALLVAAPLVLCFSFILPYTTGIFAFAEFGATPLIIIAISLYYSVLKHGLFDIKAVIVRTVGYVVSVGVVAIIYVVSTYAVSIALLSFGASAVDVSPISVVLALTIALIFQPIKRFFDKATDRLFYRNEYNRDAFLREFGNILAHDIDLGLLLRQSGAYIASTLKSDRVFFYIVNRGIFKAGGTRLAPRRVLESDISIIQSYYQKHHKSPDVISVDSAASKEVVSVLNSYNAGIVLPLMIQGQSIGYLFIGEHKGRGYRVMDMQVIESIGNELSIAVQNSLAVEEIRDLNENLQHKVETATKELRASNRQLKRLDETKNEFISMASHQLRTPLTSVKGYLDMVLQGDLGRVTSTQRAVLYEAFLSSERMVLLINDFLNISRLQTGKFSIERVKSNLAKVIREELKMMDVLAEQRNLKLKDNIDENIPDMNVDAEKLRQVIINMIDNAIYYSRSGTNIYISLKQEGNELVFKVKDTGIGIPKSEQAGLFGKFFRASNARRRRPDGTGVGLFLAKKIVTLHGGKIIFESEENKGSTFGFRLPMNKQ